MGVPIIFFARKITCLWCLQFYHFITDALYKHIVLEFRMMNFVRAEPDTSLLIYVLTCISAIVNVKVRRNWVKKPQHEENFSNVQWFLHQTANTCHKVNDKTHTRLCLQLYVTQLDKIHDSYTLAWTRHKSYWYWMPDMTTTLITQGGLSTSS